MKIFHLRFDRNELSGAFGDIGTDLPLLIGIILASGIDVASTLIMFGVMQIFTGFRYGIPMSVQPLKAFAAIVISQNVTGSIIYAGGLVIGIIMLIFTVTKLINYFSLVIPKCVIRGIQFGLGLQLAMNAINKFIIPSDIIGYIVAFISFIIAILLIGNRKYPPALFIIGIGILSALIFSNINFNSIFQNTGFHLPKINIDFSWSNIISGFLILALPQIPLSVSNSIIATNQLAFDYFPEKKVTVQKISFTYSLMNIINPFFSGFPTCHGAGGMAGHYLFGGRTGGSVVIYGSMFLILGLFFANSFHELIKIFPLSVLGVLLFFEGFALLKLIGDTTERKSNFLIALMVGLIAGFVPYGFLIGLIAGIVIYYLANKNIIGLMNKKD